jgi:hypothetical protein
VQLTRSDGTCIQHERVQYNNHSACYALFRYEIRRAIARNSDVVNDVHVALEALNDRANFNERPAINPRV